LEKVLEHLPFLVYLDSFRYPLASEFPNHRTGPYQPHPGDWGLEAGVLADVYRNDSTRRVCQVELVDNYEHKHQAISPRKPGERDFEDVH
jgi:glucosyl-3-phosphoglycerate synthase